MNLRSAAFASLLLSVPLYVPRVASAQNAVVYRLSYARVGDTSVHVAIVLPQPRTAPIAVVIPRSYPGGYKQIPYDSYVTNVHGFSEANATLEVKRDPDGPRWLIGRSGESAARIEYDVDVERMEREQLSAVDSSKVRKGYAGLLGYSVFAFVDGLEALPIELEIDSPARWPIVATLAPQTAAEDSGERSRLSVAGADYYHLADSEILMGPELRVERIDGPVPLVLAIYAECDVDAAIESRLAREALDRVAAYFGSPLAHYTVQLELLKPLPKHDYDFAQEHVDSGTFSMSIERAITVKTEQREKDARLFGLAHHMAHSWIPKRAYGIGYMPFNWEITPVIDTIWFNEGFAQYAAMEALAAPLPAKEAAAFREARLERYRNILRDAPALIQRMSLVELSREASFLYSDDFRLGMNTFSRGALMAADFDQSIRETTHNAKTLRDALVALIAQTDKSHQPFAIDDLPVIFANATGADAAALRAILSRWMQPQLRIN